MLINIELSYAQQFLLPTLNFFVFPCILHCLCTYWSLIPLFAALFLRLTMTAFSTFCHHLFLLSALSLPLSTFFFSLSHHPSLLYQHFYLLGPFFTFQSLALSAFALKMYLQSYFTVCELFFPYINLPDYRISVQTVQSHTQTSIHQSLSQANRLDIQSSMRVICKIQLLLDNQMKSLL